MRCILAVLDDPNATAPERELDTEHALALARAMLDGGRISPFVVCTRGGAVAERLAGSAVPHLAVPPDASAFWLGVRLRWRTRHMRVLLVMTFGRPSVDVGYWLTRLRPREMTMSAHAFLLRPPSQEDLLSSWRNRLLLSQCVFCGSRHVRERLASCGADADMPRGPGPKRLQILEPGAGEAVAGFRKLEPRAYPAEAPEGGEAPRFIFAMLDGLAPESGAMTVIRAMSALWQRTDLPPWEMRIYGGGARFEEIMEEAGRLGVRSRLSVLGRQNDVVLADALSRAHAVIVPGTSPEEAPSTLWAGMAAGLPSIVSVAPLHEERLRAFLCADGAALPFEADNPQSLAETMMSVMRDAALRESLAARGREESDGHSLDRAVRSWLEFLENWFERRGWIEW